MASEPTEGTTIAVSLPSELDNWLTEQAATLGVDRETVATQLLASYHAAAELDGDLDLVEAAELPAAAEEAVVAQLDDRVESAVEAELDGRVTAAVESVLDAESGDSVESIRQELAGRIEEVETEYREDLDDVRGRVVQLKRELDGKAPAEHSHDDLDRVDEIADRLDEVEESTDELLAQLDEMEERLETVAWVVNDLRDAYESQKSVETVDRIKRTAAAEDIERAQCENCGNAVALGLLTAPECPHCEATVTNVEPAAGFFGKPRLLTAAQLDADG